MVHSLTGGTAYVPTSTGKSRRRLLPPALAARSTCDADTSRVMSPVGVRGMSAYDVDGRALCQHEQEPGLESFHIPQLSAISAYKFYSPVCYSLLPRLLLAFMYMQHGQMYPISAWKIPPQAGAGAGSGAGV